MPKKPSDRFGFNPGEGVTITHSQCKDCANEEGFKECKIFITKPDKFALTSSNVKCPFREDK